MEVEQLRLQDFDVKGTLQEFISLEVLIYLAGDRKISIERVWNNVDYEKSREGWFLNGLLNRSIFWDEIQNALEKQFSLFSNFKKKLSSLNPNYS